MFSAEKPDIKNHEAAASACTAIQVAMQEPLHRSALVSDVRWKVGRSGLHRSTLTVSFRPSGRALRKKVRVTVDGRQPELVRLNGRVVDLHMAAHEAVLKIESEGNRA